ncbi:S41 family peptidase [Pontibacter sp. HSC-36F09]|uniref:S41 family peptidase n=1 Tax=Pontibacter sp. HSC-36F09 TaxID=2910966 RepID=UPI00209E42F4|nr:S41 family peptidase [Pontibacter sp. HSC-36F09]MCP2044124.1 hypothetical protein [Pontibacter sp. HSC-36F09]
MRLKQALAILFMIGLLACKKDDDLQIRKDLPQLHIEEIINIAKREAVYRHQIDWEDLEKKVKAKAANAKTIEETYPAIELALTLLQEFHSMYVSPIGETVHNPDRGCNEAFPNPVPRDEAIGYIKINSMAGTDPRALNAYVKAMHDSIQIADEREVKGWIVDLRGNRGGNMAPMLLGVGPILGNGIAGYFVDTDDVWKCWQYDDIGRLSVCSTSKENGGRMVQKEAYRLIRTNLNPYPKVALLVDGEVASSGEIVFISFIGRPNARSFGSPSCGASTELRSYRLNNGARLNLARALFADRNLKTYGKEVLPDEILPDKEAVARAIEWIKE